jgi:hypothetical protein
MKKAGVTMDQTEQKPWQKAGTRKGIIISFSMFLLFSAVLLIVYSLSVANVSTSDALTGQAALERASDAYDAIKFSLSLLPNASLNYSINGTSSFILTETMPAQIINGSGGDFLVLKGFAENYSLTSISMDVISGFPLPLLIDPHNMTVIQNGTEIVFQPLDNSSGTAVTSYTIDMTIDSSPTPTIDWDVLNNVSKNSSDAVFIDASARTAGGPSNDTSGYINRSTFNRLVFTHEGADIMNATFDGTFLIGGLDISALPSPFIVQRLVNNVFLANDSNWTLVPGAQSNIAWVNSGRTGGSERVTLTAASTGNTNNILQNISVTAIPDFANVSWCYNVSRYVNNGSVNNISIFIKSPTNASPGTLIDRVNLTGLTTDFICRNATVNGSFFASTGNYTFLARLRMVTGAGAGRNVTVLLDDFYWNMTFIQGTPGMNASSVIDRISGGVVPSNITVSVGDEFRKTITNG